VEHALESLTRAFLLLQELAIGGTAVGTGLNAPKNFGRRVCTLLAEWEQFPYMPARNAFEAQACHDPLIELSGILRRMACSLFKIANDLRWLASGPRCGLGELKLPVHEEGSTMMPGKFNPTQCEIVLMRMIQQQGCDVACAIGGMQGQFELHGMKPLLLHNLLRSIDLIAESAQTFTFQCVKGIQPNLETLRKNVHNNLMSVTALSPEIGYEKASEVVLKAQNEGLSIEEAAKKLGVNFRY
jgi:fumarate hydratase class II